MTPVRYGFKAKPAGATRARAHVRAIDCIDCMAESESTRDRVPINKVYNAHGSRRVIIHARGLRANPGQV